MPTTERFKQRAPAF